MIRLRTLIAANWKEHPKTEAEALKLFRTVAKIKREKGAEVAICPPFIYLEEITKHFRRMSLPARERLAVGAQDVFWEEQGAFTSEVGPKMLRSLGVAYAIVGHSERRKFEKETDAMINKKIKLAVRDKLKIILCVGEPLAVRKKGIAAAKKFVSRQLLEDLKGISLKSGDVAVAYEPIWAIGTGRNDKPEDAREMALFVKALLKKRKKINPRFLYGGSVNGGNAADYIQLNEIDGALIGGASLKADEFRKIINSL
jgi:triosephosphate isomerase